MAYKQKGFPMHSTKSALKAHPSKELDRLKADVKTFQSQYNEDPNERTKKDLDWAKQALEEYMSGAHGDSPLESVDDTEGTTWVQMLKKMVETGVPHEKKKKKTTEERLAEIEQMQEWWDKKDERKKKTEERDRVNEEIERIEKEHDKRWKNMGFPY
tara:strand:+ start:70 stop:540 length:471 start_codon:yes stop_codon:yes gene_type:complete